MPDVLTSVVLDRADVADSADQLLLHELLWCSEPQFNLRQPPRGRPPRRWSVGGKTFQLPLDGDLTGALASLQHSLIRACEDRSTVWREVRDDVGLLIEATLTSRELICVNLSEWHWMPPPYDLLDERVLSAAARLTSAREKVGSPTWDVVEPLIAHIERKGALKFRWNDPEADPSEWDVRPGRLERADREARVPSMYEFGAFEIFYADHLTPFEVVQVADTRSTVHDLERRTAAGVVEVRRSLGSRVGGAVGRGGEFDWWILEGPDGSVRLDPSVTRVCESIARLATRIAPPFVTRRYDIALVPRSVREMMGASADAPPVRLGLCPHSDPTIVFHLDSVGSGLAVWTGYAVLAAARRIALEPGKFGLHDDPDFDPARHRGQRFRGTSVSGATRKGPHSDLGRRVAAWERPVIYVVDEPERHLHPTAQDEVAQSAGGARDSATDIGGNRNARDSTPGDAVRPH